MSRGYLQMNYGYVIFEDILKSLEEILKRIEDIFK